MFDIESVPIGDGARGNTFEYVPDCTGNPEAGHLVAVTDASGNRRSFTRDDYGRALSVALAGDDMALGYPAMSDLESGTTATGDDCR